MAVSASFDFTLNRDQIIEEAMEVIGVIITGGSASSDEITSCSKKLNMMLKAWQAEGIGLWYLLEIALFQSNGGFVYNIGPSGDRASTSWVKQELASAAASGASTVTVDDDDGISAADIIGVELDSGVIDWDVISGTPSANVITLTSTLDGAAAIDNHVYTYTSLTQRPLEIIEARLVREDATEIPLEIVSRAEYLALNNKAATGTPNQVYYEPILTNGKLYVWQACGNVKEYIKFTGRHPFDDMDATANNASFPQEYLEAIVYNLALRIAPGFGKPISPGLIALASSFKKIASDFDREETSVYFDIGD